MSNINFWDQRILKHGLKSDLILIRGIAGSGTSTMLNAVYELLQHTANQLPELNWQGRLCDMAGYANQGKIDSMSYKGMYCDVAYGLRMKACNFVCSRFITEKSIDQYKVLAEKSGKDILVLRCTGNFPSKFATEHDRQAQARMIEPYPGELLLNVPPFANRAGRYYPPSISIEPPIVYMAPFNQPQISFPLSNILP